MGIGRILLRKSINNSLRKADLQSNVGKGMSIMLPLETSFNLPMTGRHKRQKPFLVYSKNGAQDGLKYPKKSRAGKFLF